MLDLASILCTKSKMELFFSFSFFCLQICSLVVHKRSRNEGWLVKVEWDVLILDCFIRQKFEGGGKKVLPGVEPRSLDSKSRVLTTTP